MGFSLDLDLDSDRRFLINDSTVASCFNFKCAYVCNWNVGNEHTYTHTHNSNLWSDSILLVFFLFFAWRWIAAVRTLLFFPLLEMSILFVLLDKLFTNVLLIIWRNHSQLMLISNVLCQPFDRIHQEWQHPLESITCVFVWRIEIYSLSPSLPLYFICTTHWIVFDFRLFIHRAIRSQ